MWPKYFAISIFLLVISVLGLIFTSVFPSVQVTSVCMLILMAANLMAVFYLARFGQLFQTPYRFLIYVLMVSGAVGAVLKFQHWPVANLLLSISLIGIPLAYLIWFLVKPDKRGNDFMKLLWVFCNFFITYNLIAQLLPLGKWETVIGILNTLLLQVTYVQFYYWYKRQPPEITLRP